MNIIEVAAMYNTRQAILNMTTFLTQHTKFTTGY